MAAGGFLSMDFPLRLATIRKERELSQKTLAQMVGINLSQLRRYEAGTSQPTLAVLRRLAIALRVTSDFLVFDHDERGPDDELRLQFEAISRLDSAEKAVIKTVVESIIVRHDAKQWLAPPSVVVPSERKNSRTKDRKPLAVGARK